MKVLAKATDGVEKVLHVLVDTEAEVDLLNLRVWEDGWQRARKPVRLMAVNGHHLRGGERTMKLQLLFGAESLSGIGQGTQVAKFNVNFLDANMD